MAENQTTTKVKTAAGSAKQTATAEEIRKPDTKQVALVVLVAGVLSFWVGLAASNIYFRFAELPPGSTIDMVFDTEREMGTFIRLAGQYAFCNVLQWQMETHSLGSTALLLIPAFSFSFIFLLAMIYMPRDLWTRDYTAKVSVAAATAHGILVCLMLILMATVFKQDFYGWAYPGGSTGWDVYHGEMVGWLPMAMAVSVLWSIFLGSVVGAILGTFLESFRGRVNNL